MKRPWLWVAVLLLAAAGIYGIANLTESHPTTPPSVLTTRPIHSHPAKNKPPAHVQRPQTKQPGPATFYAVIPAYYGSVNARNYAAAYRLYAPSWQKDHPFASFAAGYANTRQVTATEAVDSVGNFNASVEVSLTALLNDGQVQHFSGTVNLQDISQGAGPADWRIVSFQITPVSN